MATSWLVSPATCTCVHSPHCDHECHSGYGVPDDAMPGASGCAECTPGRALPHHEDCPTLVPAEFVWGCPELS